MAKPFDPTENDLCDEAVCPHDACVEMLEDQATWPRTKALWVCPEHGEIDFSIFL